MRPSPLGTEQFETLLGHLGETREEAGVRYEQLRTRLITVFAYRRCASPEELADETLTRVAHRLHADRERPDGADLVRFAYGVAWNVAHEALRADRTIAWPEGFDPASPGRSDASAGDEHMQACLERCLARLTEADRKVVLRYFQGEKSARIHDRARLARELQLSPNALRLKIYRMTSALRQCLIDCAGPNVTRLRPRRSGIRRTPPDGIDEP